MPVVLVADNDLRASYSYASLFLRILYSPQFIYFWAGGASSFDFISVVRGVAFTLGFRHMICPGQSNGQPPGPYNRFLSVYWSPLWLVRLPQPLSYPAIAAQSLQPYIIISVGTSPSATPTDHFTLPPDVTRLG